jgi:hypothetical protein
MQPIDLNDLNNDLNSERNLMDSAEDKMNEFNASELDQRSHSAIVEDTAMQSEEMQHEDIDSTIEVSNVLDGAGCVPTLFEDQITVNVTEDAAIEPSNKIQRIDEGNLNKSAEELIENNDNDNQENTDQPIELAADSNKSSGVVIEKQMKAKRRRKLIIDDVKEIDSNSMKIQLSDTSSILGQLELAPPTRRLMQLKETSGVDKMFSSTSRSLHNKNLLKVNVFLVILFALI